MKKGEEMKKRRDYLAIATIILLAIISIVGILSLNFQCAGEVLNQYGQKVQIYGYGIYAHDTYFQAPISIGTDICILLIVIPLFLYSYITDCKNKNTISEIRLISMYAVSLYYAISIAFGLVFNQLFLFYIALLVCSLFGMFIHIANVEKVKAVSISRGLTIFLIISGLALLLAWMPDVIPALIQGTTLSTIGIYTTGTTYIIDMGVVSPLCFAIIFLLKKSKPVGTIILASMLRLCIIVGIMMFPQMICQYASGCDMPLPALMTKSFSFVLLGIFAAIFQKKMYREISAYSSGNIEKGNI